MKAKVAHSAYSASDIEDLYHQFLESFYVKGNRNRKKTDKLAEQLQGALDNCPEFAQSIRGEEVASLIAESQGDFAQAARSREAEIRKILLLHAWSAYSRNWKFVLSQYDFSDLSDRLDLLAGLYQKQGDLDRAIQTLLESKNYCESHKIVFDGADMLQEFQSQQAKLAKRASARTSH